MPHAITAEDARLPREGSGDFGDAHQLTLGTWNPRMPSHPEIPYVRGRSRSTYAMRILRAVNPSMANLADQAATAARVQLATRTTLAALGLDDMEAAA